MYRTVKAFADAQDNNHVYQTGDVYPRSGVVVTDARLFELRTSANRLRMPLIELVNEDKGNTQAEAENAPEVQKNVKKEHSELKEQKTAENKPKRQYKKRVNADA